ncbi:hypothetical protein M3Y97_01055200 [Aphelenchoides bicaudatus]|nr:hypothetical protein M3Y97_01055200 [Aphelenchoides bicaudatus]
METDHLNGNFQLLDLISTSLGVSVEFIDPDNDPASKLAVSLNISENDAGIRLFHNGTFDLIGAFFDVSTLYGYEFELSNPVYYNQAKYIVAPTKSSLSGIFDFFTVYENSIWVGIFAIFILIGLLIHQFELRLKNTKTTGFAYYSWQLFRLQLNQSETITHKFASGNFLILIFALFHCGLVIRMYNNMIKTQAVHIVDPHPFKEQEILQVLKEGKYSLIFQSGFRWWYKEIMDLNSTTSPFYEIRMATKDNPIQLADQLTDNYDDLDFFIFEKIKQGRWITIGSNEDIQAFRQMGYCNMVYMEASRHRIPLKSF